MRRALLLADAALRLGPRAVARRLLFGALRPLARARLADAAVPEGPFFLPGPEQPPHGPGGMPPPDARPGTMAGGPHPPSPAPVPPLPPGAAERLAAALPDGPPDWHGPFDPRTHALDLDLFAAGDIRPVWERNRLLAVPLLAALHRIAPRAGHLARTEALLGAWCRANPPFRGPAWACGQEASFRALHLLLARALLEQDGAPPTPGMAALLALHARRIAATRAYALAQDNNHPISEAAAAFALGDPAAGARLSALCGRLIAPDGGFAQVSPAYLRALCDTLSVVEWLRRRAGAPPLPQPFAARAAAAARLLGRLASPGTGALPRIGPMDGAQVADLSAAGENDAGGSAERALRLFCDEGFGRDNDLGCALLGLPAPARALPRLAVWRADGYAAWEAGGMQAVLRAGPLRFRPGQADLLHLDLRLDGLPLLSDAGSPTYNPPRGVPWAGYFEATRAHNAAAFDEDGPWHGDQMPRVGRFLFARWPKVAALPDGAVLTDRRGNRHARRVAREGRRLVVVDELSGPFRDAVLRWRLGGDGPWRLSAEGAEGPGVTLSVLADRPVALALATGWESPAQGIVRPVPVLEARFGAGPCRVRSVVTST